MADEKLCTCCGNMVEITPVYAEVGDSESGPIVEIVDCLSLCDCGHDVLTYICYACNGDGCPACDDDFQP